MTRRRWTGWTAAQHHELWQRWQQGETLSAISRALVKQTGSIHHALAVHGGIAPPARRRAARVLSLAEREGISRGLAAGHTVRAIGRSLGRAPSTISREIQRHGGPCAYRATLADTAAWEQARRPQACQLARRPRLRRIVASLLAQHWSPAQIAGWLQRTYPGEPAMHISHETIYRSLYVQARGVLRRELQQCLRTRRTMRHARTRATTPDGRGQIVAAVPISARPPEVADRAVPGHWEGDLIAGAEQTYLATLVERTSRFTLLVPVANKQSATVIAALQRQIRHLPLQLRRSLTWDRGHEMAAHRDFTVATQVAVYFCDPQSPWQRGTNENTNGLLRQYFPKGTSLAGISARRLNQVAAELNGRPRKALDFQTPAEVFQQCVASTG